MQVCIKALAALEFNAFLCISQSKLFLSFSLERFSPFPVLNFNRCDLLVTGCCVVQTVQRGGGGNGGF